MQRQSEKIRLVKEGKDWRLAQPVKDQADGITLNSLLTTLASLHQDRDLGPEKDLKSFGLDQPPLIVSFTVGDQTHTLAVGKKIPGGQGYYARRDQDPRVLIIAASSKESLDRPLSVLRNRALFDFTMEQVKAFRVKTGDKQVVLEKKGGHLALGRSGKVHHLPGPPGAPSALCQSGSGQGLRVRRAPGPRRLWPCSPRPGDYRGD